MLDRAYIAAERAHVAAEEAKKEEEKAVREAKKLERNEVKGGVEVGVEGEAAKLRKSPP